MSLWLGIDHGHCESHHANAARTQSLARGPTARDPTDGPRPHDPLLNCPRYSSPTAPPAPQAAAQRLNGQRPAAPQPAARGPTVNSPNSPRSTAQRPNSPRANNRGPRPNGPCSFLNKCLCFAATQHFAEICWKTVWTFAIGLTSLPVSRGQGEALHFSIDLRICRNAGYKCRDQYCQPAIFELTHTEANGTRRALIGLS